MEFVSWDDYSQYDCQYMENHNPFHGSSHHQPGYSQFAYLHLHNIREGWIGPWGPTSFRVVLNDQRLWTWPGPKNSFYAFLAYVLKCLKQTWGFKLWASVSGSSRFEALSFVGLVFRPKQLVSTSQAYFKSLPSLRLPAKRGISFFGGDWGIMCFFPG